MGWVGEGIPTRIMRIMGKGQLYTKTHWPTHWPRVLADYLLDIMMLPQGELGVVSLSSGKTIDLEIWFLDSMSGELVPLDSVALSFYDLDEASVRI